MDKNVIRLSKSVKIIGTTGIVIFIIIFALYFTENFLASLLCIPVILLGAVLLLAYKEETIILKDDELVFNYLVKKTQHIKYDRIHCLLIIPLNRRTEIALIDKEYNRLISLNILLANIDYLFEKLEEKNVQILDLGEMIEKNQDISQYTRALNRVERNYYEAIDINIKNFEKIFKKGIKFDIKKTKQRLKVMGWILIFSDLAAFLIGDKGMLIIFCAVPLVSYAIYIKYYPYIYIDSFKGKDRFLNIPFFGPVIALTMNLLIADSRNYNIGDSMKITVCMTFVLVIPFVIKSAKTSVFQKLSRKISVILAAFMIAFAITIPVNILLTFDPAVHKTTIITDKDMDNSGKLRNYNLYGQLNGKEEKFSVAKSVYNETDIGDLRKICIKRSVLGLEYYTIHK